MSQHMMFDNAPESQRVLNKHVRHSLLLFAPRVACAADRLTSGHVCKTLGSHAPSAGRCTAACGLMLEQQTGMMVQACA
jgi:hypothetical protein